MEIVSIAHVKDIANAYMEHPGLSDAINTINTSILEAAEQGGLRVSINLKKFNGFESYKEELIKKMVRAGYDVNINYFDNFGFNLSSLDISWHD